MPWYQWLAVALVSLLVLGLLAYRLLRATRRGRSFLHLPLRAKLRFGSILLQDTRTPLLARGLLVLLVAYLALPFDIIPDFIPVLGQLDDVLIAAAALLLLIALIPRDHFEAAFESARREEDDRRSASASPPRP